MPPAAGPDRRDADRSSLIRPAIRRLSSLIGRLDPVTGGQFLLLFNGAGVALGAALLNPSGHDFVMLIVISATMIAVLALSALIPWTRLPHGASAAFPLAAFTGFAALGLLAPDLTSALTPLLTAVYLYSGLTQRPGSSLWVVPAGCTTFVVMNGGLTDAVLVRVIIGMLVWTTLVELLAAFVQQQERLARALSEAAHCDALTGIPNRRDLEARMITVQPGDALVVCDLDHFKLLNDTRGHHVGDRTLADFGSLLRLHLRGDDYCARFGGEEFVLLLPATDAAGALAVVERLRMAWGLMQPATTFSAGIAIASTGRSPAETMVAADAALYDAKACGRDVTRTEPVGLASRV